MNQRVPVLAYNLGIPISRLYLCRRVQVPFLSPPSPIQSFYRTLITKTKMQKLDAVTKVCKLFADRSMVDLMMLDVQALTIS